MRTEAVLAGGNCTLAPLLPEHVTANYVSWLSDPVVVGMTEQSGRTHTADGVRQYVVASLAARDAYLWRILLEDRHVGNIRLSGINRGHARASIGIIIGESSARGRGVGSTAIDLLARHALMDLGLHKVTAGIYAPNTASIGAFLKAGFHIEATLVGHRRHEDRFIDEILMARFAAPAQSTL